MTLYNIVGKLKDLQELLESGEYDEQMLTDTMDAVEGEFADKAEKYIWLSKQMDSDAKGMKAMADDFYRKQKVLENGSKQIKERLLSMMDAANIPEVKGEHFSIKPVKNGGVLPLVMTTDIKAEDLPAEYQKQKVEVDTEAIRNALDKGIELGFAHYGERGRRLNVR